MSVKLDISGLEKLQRNIKKLEGKRNIPLSELMPDTFISRNSKFRSLQAFLNAGGVRGDHDIGSSEFSRFVSAKTRFRSWEEMKQAAGAEWAKRQLGF